MEFLTNPTLMKDREVEGRSSAASRDPTWVPVLRGEKEEKFSGGGIKSYFTAYNVSHCISMK